MRFALSDDQVAFRDAVRDLLAKECTPAVVRAAWEAPAGQLDRGVWDSLDAMGVLGVLVPEAHGGLGLDETYLVPILEEAGRAALPHALVETAMVAAPLLGTSAGMVTTDLGGRVIPCAADADVLLLRDGGRLVRTTPADIELAPAATVDGGRRATTLAPATDDDTCGRAMSQAGETTPGTASPATDHDTYGRAMSQAGERTSGTASPTTTRRAVSQAAGAVVTDDPGTIELALDRGALGTAAVLIGLGQAMLDMTVGYVQERHQFGKPIGSFQAVKHHLADAALALEFARPAVWRAAWSVAHGEPTRARDVSMAKAMASDAAELVGRKALQCHGAIGYTVEADLHLYLKRTWALARSWGDAAVHTDRVAAAIGD